MEDRTIFLGLLLALPVAAVCNAAYFGTELKRFLDSTPRLESTNDVERFKTVVGRQMIAALVQIALLAIPLLLYFGGIFIGVLSPSDFVFVLGPSMVILLVAAVYRGAEKRAKSLPAADPELERQRDAIVHTWMRKPWPEW